MSAHLGQPAYDDERRRHAFLVVPDVHRRLSPFLRRHITRGITASGLHDLLLCRRRNLLLSIVWGVDPPRHEKENGPGSREDVVRKERVGEVQRVFRVLLRDRFAASKAQHIDNAQVTDPSNSLQSPHERNETKHRVDVHGELCCGPACAREDSDQPVDTCDLVQDLCRRHEVLQQYELVEDNVQRTEWPSRRQS